MTAFQHLLAGAIDYAGAFPPASLDVESSLVNYSSYLTSNESWALGRIILPAAALHLCCGTPSISPSRVSVLLGSDCKNDIETAAGVGDFDVFECEVSSISDIEIVAQMAPKNAQVFYEGPRGVITPEWAATIKRVGGAAKIRTGGPTPDAIPSAIEVTCFLAGCIVQQIPFKATAGLHHPIRSSHALTYEADSPIATMHGFVNVMVATALLASGERVETATAVIEDMEPRSFEWRADSLWWRGIRVSIDQIDFMRHRVLSFGSCSFSEPVDESKALSWLQ